MKRNYILSLLAAFMLLPFASLKAQYHAGDSTVCYNIMTNNFASTNLLNWNDPNPGNWLGVNWNTATPKRIIELNINGSASNSNGSSTNGGDHGTAIEKFDFTSTGNEAGVDAPLKGNVDFSGLSELVLLNLLSQDSIISVNVSGLNKLEYLSIARADYMTSLDVSGLSNLLHLHTGNMNGLLNVDASNCPRLKALKLNRASNTLLTLDISGSDSLQWINLKDMMDMTNGFDTLDLTGKTELYHLAIAEGNISTILGMSDLTKLRYFKAAKNKLKGTVNINNFDTTNLVKFNVRSNNVDSVEGWTSLSGSSNIGVLNVDDNWLTLDNATQIANETTSNGSTNNGIDGATQTRYGGDTIYVGGMKDFSPEALIDINGTNNASSFQLFDNGGTPVGAANATGIFNFPLPTDAGEYYVEMTNDGNPVAAQTVTLTTNNFWVLKCANDTSTTVSGSTITSNQAGATYRWLDCNNGNAVIAGATSQSYTPSVNGDYAVEITLSSPCATVDTSACVNMTSVGINTFASSTVNIYPNPVKDQFTIELSSIENDTYVSVVNMEGKVVYNAANLTNSRLVINSSNWSKGIYFVKVNNNNETNTFKLVK